MRQKNSKKLVFSVLLCFLLVLSVSCVVVQPGMSVGKWSDPLPTVDGQITGDDMTKSDHLQIKNMQILEYGEYGPELGKLEWTSDFEIFAATNSTHLYLGINMTNMPYIANADVISGPPTGNYTLIYLYVDNDNSDWIDDLEDAKAFGIFDETTMMAQDQFWNDTEGEYESDVPEGAGPPDPQNITAFYIKHSNSTAQGNIGNLTLEFFMHLGDDHQGLDGGGIPDSVPFGFAIEVQIWVNGVMGGNGGLPPVDNIYFGESTNNFTRDDNDASLFHDVIVDHSPASPLSSFSADGVITQTEKTASDNSMVVSDVEIYGMYAYESTVDIYVANNATHLYVGAEMSDLPYFANINWTNDFFGVGYHNFTTIRVVFDNNNNDVLDHQEDAKLVMHGNNSFSLADDQLFNSTQEADPLGGNFTSDSQHEHSFPPEQGDIAAFDIKHSNPSSQGAIGVLTFELIMPLSGDTSGYDGIDLEGTVGFSIYYLAIINFNTTAMNGNGNGEGSGLERFFVGATAGGTFTYDDASDFHDLEIISLDTTNPTINSPDDVTYEEGETGNSITWLANDDNPNKYTITKNDTVVDSGDWQSGEGITIDVDGLEAGVYIYVCTVNDTSGNSASDEVTVTVTEVVSEFSYGYAFIALVALPLIALITYKKTRKLRT